jgi:hypothetical protein
VILAVKLFPETEKLAGNEAVPRLVVILAGVPVVLMVGIEGV